MNIDYRLMHWPGQILTNDKASNTIFINWYKWNMTNMSQIKNKSLLFYGMPEIKCEVGQPNKRMCILKKKKKKLRMD